MTQSIKRKGTVGRDEDQQETNQADEVEMVEISSFFEEKNIGEAEEEQNSTDAIPETEGNKDGKDSQSYKVKVHSFSWPGLNPIKTIVGEVKDWVDPITPNPVMGEIAPHFPKHNDAKSNTEVDQRSNVNG